MSVLSYSYCIICMISDFSLTVFITYYVNLALKSQGSKISQVNKNTSALSGGLNFIIQYLKYIINCTGGKSRTCNPEMWFGIQGN